MYVGQKIDLAALTWLSLTLHCNRRKFSISITFIFKLFYMLYNWMNYLLFYLLSVIFLLKSLILSYTACRQQISTNKQITQFLRQNWVKISGAINLKFKIRIILRERGLSPSSSFRFNALPTWMEYLKQLLKLKN